MKNWLYPIPLFLLLMVGCAQASAGLYCVMDFGGKRCEYEDLLSCQQAAGEQGSCFLNEEQMLMPTGGSPFCLVEPRQTQCIYRTRADCDRDAFPRRASCLPNPNLRR